MGIETPPGGILPTRKAKSQPSTSCATSLASLQGLFIPDCQAKTWAPPCSAPPRSAVHLPPWTLFSHILCTTFPHRQPAWRLSAHPALYPLSVLPALQTQLSTVLALMLDFLLSSWSASVWRQAVCGHIFFKESTFASLTARLHCLFSVWLSLGFYWRLLPHLVQPMAGYFSVLK